MANFETFIRMLDSPQEGERANALESLHRLRAKENWPTFGEMIDRMNNTVPIDVHNQALQDLEALRQQLARRFAFTLPRINRRGIAGIAAITVGVIGWFFSGGSDGSHVQSVAVASLARTLPSATWSEGDTAPVIVRVNGYGDYWALLRGSLDSTTHADPDGHLVERRCLDLFAAPAVSDGGAFLRPAPYNSLGQLRWPLVAHECRLPRSGTEARR